MASPSLVHDDTLIVWVFQPWLRLYSFAVSWWCAVVGSHIDLYLFTKTTCTFRAPHFYTIIYNVKLRAYTWGLEIHIAMTHFISPANKRTCECWRPKINKWGFRKMLKIANIKMFWVVIEFLFVHSSESTVNRVGTLYQVTEIEMYTHSIAVTVNYAFHPCPTSLYLKIPLCPRYLKCSRGI